MNTTVLNLVFLTAAAVLGWRYFRKGGGIIMLRMMNTAMSDQPEPAHARVHPSE